MKKITLFLVMLFLSFSGFAQQLPETFEGTTVPNLVTDDWVLNSGTWKVFDNGIGTAQSWEAIPAPNGCNGRSAYLNRENVTDGTFAEDWLVTHQVPVPSNGQLRFTTRQTLAANFGSIYTIRVSTTSQTDVTTFTTIQTWNETDLNAVYNICEEKIVDLPAVYHNQNVYIAFVMTNDNGDRWIIDDVNLVEKCLEPTTQTSSNPTLTSVQLGWNNPSGATQWEIEIVTTGDTPTGTGTVVSSNPYTATGLTQGTCYDFYVRALCGSGPTASSSIWVGPYNFCTSSLGENCGAPIVVPGVPYVTTDNTSGYGDDYNGTPGTTATCGTGGQYLNGNDVFYEFTSTTGNPITITSQTNNNFAGLFVYNSCANVGVSCVAGNTGGNGSTTPDSVSFTPTIGQPYYIVISTWASPQPQSVDYTLTIVENTCTNMTADFAVLTNCPSGTDTFYVTANVTNMGTATSITGTSTPASPTTVPSLTAPGTMQFGPFPNGTNVSVNLQNDQDANCFRNSAVLTQQFCPAPNNLCANAIPLTCNSTVSGTTQGSTNVGATGAFCGTASNTSAGVWYTFAGNGDVVTFSLCGSNFDTKLQVFTGSCGAFNCVTGNDNSCGTQSEVQFATVAGTNYFIYVFGATNTTQGGFVLNTTCVTPPPPPVNDNCDAATVVPVNIDGTCNQIVSGTVVGATPSSQTNGCVGSADDDVWFTFTATQSIHTISIQNVAGSTLDLNHVVYTSTNTTNPCGNLTQVFCSNPDFSYLTGLVPGQVYFIRVYTNTAALLQTTTFDICISVPPPPPSNDSCANPIVVPVNGANDCAQVVAGTITSATPSPEPNACGGTADDDVWFQFTAIHPTHIISLNNILGNNNNLNFVVYSGASCGSLTQVACNLPNTGIINNLTPGTTYYIRVYTDTAAVGQFSSFDLCIGSIPLTLDNTTYTVPQLVTDVLIDSPCGLVTNITWQTGTGVNGNGIAYFEENAPGVMPFPNGIVLSTGNAMRSSGPNNAGLSDTSAGWGGDAQLFNYIQSLGIDPGLNSYNNATILEFDFVPLISDFSFDFMFASEEYGTFQCAYSDAFAFFLTDMSTNTTTNLAVLPGITPVAPVSVVTVRDNAYNAGCPSVNPQFFDVYNLDNPASPNATANAVTNYNGQTVMLTASAIVTPQTPYHIKMVIADRNDTAFDSAVFIAGNSFNIGNIELGNDYLEANGTALCEGDSFTIQSGLDPSSYTFQWSDANGPIAGETSPDLTITQEGTYTISAQYNGTICAATDSITIEYYDPFTIGVPNDLISCNSSGYDTFDLTQNELPILDLNLPADFTVSYYESENDAENSTNAITNPASFTNTVQFLQTIYVRVENNSVGCYKIVEFDLIIQDLTPQFTMTPDFSICDGQTGTIVITPLNYNDADVTYTWTQDTTQLTDTTGTISVNQAGTYTVVVDNNGCTSTMSTVVTIDPPSITPTFNPISNICQDQTAPTLPTSSTNTTPITGTWNPATIDTSVVGTVTYTFTPDAGQCALPTTLDVTIDAPSIVPTFNPISDICQGNAVPSLPTSSADATPITGTWSPSVIDSSTVGTFTYTFTPNSGQCAVTTTLTVTITTTPIADTVSGSSVCVGSDYTFGSLSSGSYWTGPNATGTQYAPNDTFTITGDTTFYVYVSAGTCFDETSFVVSAIAAPVVTLEGGCEGATYLIHATVVGGQAVTYEWFDSNGAVIPNETDSTLAVSQDGTYSCVVTLTSGSCESDQVYFDANGTLCTIQKGISPNGDGLNENFDLTGLNVKKLEIFNRYGKKVYSFSNYTNQWYGQSDNGNELPTGTYYYVMERDNVETKSGWIYINR